MIVMNIIRITDKLLILKYGNFELEYEITKMGYKTTVLRLCKKKYIYPWSRI